MRQLFLVVIVVAAAFAGGAFVNGPGLQWAQSRVLRSLGLQNGGEISSVDLKPAANLEKGSDEAGLVKPERVPGPVAPLPAVIADSQLPQDDTADISSPDRTRPASNRNAPSSPRQENLASPPPLEQPLEHASTPRELPAPDPDVKPASSSASPPDSRPLPDLAPAILDTLAGLLPADPPGSQPGSSAPPSSSPPRAVMPARKSNASGDEDWVLLERKMQSLGVCRYNIEGEPGGRVLFSCLIPVAGRQAITQRFEAEGDDIGEAARAALRRISLWRATEPASQ